MKNAKTINTKMEALVASQQSGRPPDDETSRWVGERDSVMYDKLAAVGLVPPRAKAEAETTTLAAFIDYKKHGDKTGDDITEETAHSQPQTPTWQTTRQGTPRLIDCVPNIGSRI